MGGVDIGKFKWSFYEVFWKSSSPSTVPVQQRTPDHMGNFPGNGQGSLHIQVRTLYAKDIFREKHMFSISRCSGLVTCLNPISKYLKPPHRKPIPQQAFKNYSSIVLSHVL